MHNNPSTNAQSPQFYNPTQFNPQQQQQTTSPPLGPPPQNSVHNQQQQQQQQPMYSQQNLNYYHPQQQQQQHYQQQTSTPPPQSPNSLQNLQQQGYFNPTAQPSQPVVNQPLAPPPQSFGYDPSQQHHAYVGGSKTGNYYQQPQQQFNQQQQQQYSPQPQQQFNQQQYPPQQQQQQNFGPPMTGFQHHNQQQQQNFGISTPPTDFEGGGISYDQNYQMPTQDIASQMNQLSLNQRPMQTTTTSITTGNVDTLPRPSRPNEILYDKFMNKRTQPDVSGLFMRQARSDTQQQHNFNVAQSSTTFIRSTVQCIPSTPTLAKSWHLPLGAVIHPFAENEKVPLVAMGAAGIIRCNKCRTYINPFVIFLEYGKKWQCNMCKSVNDVPNAYFCQLDENGVRKDFFKRPELLHGSVEFIAPQEYMARVPQPPAFLFLLDVSYNAVRTGMFRAAATAILSVLDQFPARTQIGFITFDSSIQFYNLKSTLTVPQMLVVGELEESLLPLPSDLLVNLQESKVVVKALLERFAAPDGMFSTTTNVESALGAALNAAGRILGRIGGKLSIFLSNLPTLGPNALANREDKSVYGTDAETALLAPADNRFKEFALLYCRDQISVDIYAMIEQQSGSQYLDLASLSSLGKFTGGTTEFYNTDATEKLRGDVVRSLTRETGLEAVMRVRASSGLKISAFYGHLFIRGHDLLALPNIDADKAYGVEFQHTGSFVSTPNASVQVAVLYTSSTGQRRIRVHNAMFPITNELSDLYRDADVDATINLMAKIAVDNVPRKGLSWVKNDIRDRVQKCLTTYKQSIKQGGGFNQIVLPDSLTLLPLYSCALAKSDALMGGQEVRADERVFAFNYLTTASCTQSNMFVHPLAFAVNEIEENEDDEQEDQSYLDLTSLHLHPLSRKLVNTETAVLLLCDGNVIYVWLGKQPLADQIISADISKVVSSLNLPEEEQQSFIPTTKIGKNLRALARTLRRDCDRIMPVRHVNEQSALWQRVFVRKLIEDKTIQSTMSYDEFLVHLYNSLGK
jgi:protein transport protein SEC24